MSYVVWDLPCWLGLLAWEMPLRQRLSWRLGTNRLALRTAIIDGNRGRRW